MNPINFVDPFGLQHWTIEEELAGEEALKAHLIRKYGAQQGEIEFSQIIGSKRRIETKMSASFLLATGGMLIAPHLSGPALIATIGSTSIYSALDAYSSRKQAGQTEGEARRGAFGAATGFNFLFNLMGLDYGTLKGISQSQIENAWSTLIGGTAGGWFGKMLTAPATETVLTKSGVLEQLKGGQLFESQRLQNIGQVKNTTAWRPTQSDINSAAFNVIVGKPKYTDTGLPVGTILDAKTLGGFLEIKSGTSILTSSYQLRLQAYYALKEGVKFTIETTRPVGKAFANWLERWGGILKKINAD